MTRGVDAKEPIAAHEALKGGASAQGATPGDRDSCSRSARRRAHGRAASIEPNYDASTTASATYKDPDKAIHNKNQAHSSIGARAA